MKEIIWQNKMEGNFPSSHVFLIPGVETKENSIFCNPNYTSDPFGIIVLVNQ